MLGMEEEVLIKGCHFLILMSLGIDGYLLPCNQEVRVSSIRPTDQTADQTHRFDDVRSFIAPYIDCATNNA